MGGGFASAVGFLFTFFIIAFAFSGVFVSYNKQVNDNSKLIKKFEINSLNSFKSDFTISNPFYMSGRMNFLIKNNNSQNLNYKIKNKNCFSVIKNNNNFISNNNFIINILKNPAADYTFIDKKNSGVLSMISNYNSLIDNTYKIISCSGIKKNYKIKIGKNDWWDSNFNLRKIINVKNNANSSLAEYQVEVNFDNSNLDFNLARENEIRFVYPLKESLVLDSPFDKIKQNLDDFSYFHNNLTLGSTNGVEISDPISTKAVILNGLSFDGINDFVRIKANKSLQLKNSLTYSAWINWGGFGATNQYIITNGIKNNSLSIVNDGGINQNKILFQLNIAGITKYLFSNTTISKNSWHQITATYDGSDMKIYLDSILVGNLSILGNIISSNLDNYIGTTGSSLFFNGSIDEVKIFNIDLKKNEVKDLFHNNLRFRQLSFYNSNFDSANKLAKYFIKIPAISANSNISFHLYYDNRNGILSNSNIFNTFSYTTPRTVGYVVSDKIANSNGVNIFSLENNNSILVGNTLFNLNELQSSTLPAASISINSSVKMKYLAQVEGKLDTNDMIVPISWAGTKFYYRGFRKSGVLDRFCMLAPFKDATASIYDNGVLQWTGLINKTGNCVNVNILTNDNMGLISTIPILVSYYGSTSQDAFVLYPATNDSLFGIPSTSGFLGVGNIPANIKVLRSDLSTATYNLASNGTASFSSGGAQGATFAHKLISTNGALMGAIQQADGDGSESTVFAPAKEMGTKFGSGLGAEYLVFSSEYPNANCSTYNSLGNLVTNIPIGTGGNGIYNYSFDVGNSITYLAPKWKVECSKPVWGYFEEDVYSDETNLFGNLQIRQYIYPAPSLIIN